MPNWDDLLPPREAITQRSAERHRSVLRARRAGATFVEIAAKLGITASRAAAIYHQAERYFRHYGVPETLRPITRAREQLFEKPQHRKYAQEILPIFWGQQGRDWLLVATPFYRKGRR